MTLVLWIRRRRLRGRKGRRGDPCGGKVGGDAPHRFGEKGVGESMGKREKGEKTVTWPEKAAAETEETRTGGGFLKVVDMDPRSRSSRIPFWSKLMMASTPRLVSKTRFSSSTTELKTSGLTAEKLDGGLDGRGEALVSMPMAEVDLVGDDGEAEVGDLKVAVVVDKVLGEETNGVLAGWKKGREDGSGHGNSGGSKGDFTKEGVLMGGDGGNGEGLCKDEEVEREKKSGGAMRRWCLRRRRSRWEEKGRMQREIQERGREGRRRLLLWDFF